MEISHNNFTMAISNLTDAMVSNSTISTTSAPDTYFTFPLYSGFIVAHIILMTTAWVFVLPISIFI